MGRMKPYRLILLSSLVLAGSCGPALSQPSDGAVCVDLQAAYALRAPACERALGANLSAAPGDEARLLINRAWFRSINHQDAAAHADYDRAVGLDGSYINYNERGFYFLRIGQFDAAIADYDHAISLNPGTAYSLYGRGLAWIRKGEQTRGEADLAQARQNDPNVDQVFRRFGLHP